MSMNWLEGPRPQMEMEGADRPMAMSVFAGQKLVVVGGSSGMGRQTAADVVAAGGSAVIIGQDAGQGRRHRPDLAKEGSAHGITADLADRMQAERVRQQLAAEHGDATLLVNAAGLFVPKPFLDHDGAVYDSYPELNRAIFFLTQTVVRGMVASGPGRVDREHRQHVGAPGHRRDPVVGLLAGQGRPDALPATWPSSSRRTTSGSTRSHRPWWPPRSTSGSSPRTSSTPRCTASTASTRWDGSAPPATWPTHHLPALPRQPAGSPAPSGRRRRRHGRPQLTPSPDRSMIVSSSGRYLPELLATWTSPGRGGGG